MILKSFTQEAAVPVSHNHRILKHVLLNRGQCANITQFARAIFPAGQKVESHSHPDMAEIFMGRSGTGKIIINGQSYNMIKDTCVIVQAGELHELVNIGTDELIVDYFGLQL